MARLVRESVDRFFDYDIHVESRTLYIGSRTSEEGEDLGVTAATAEHAIKGLHLLQSANSEPIKIILNSIGGDWYHGVAIFDSIKACPCHVTIEVLGQAMSMGSIILQAADERLIHPNATIMIHDGTEQIGPTHAKNFEAWAKSCEKQRQVMYNIYAERSGRPASFWEKKCTTDFILTAQEAVELGLADKVIGQEEAASE